MRPRYLVPVHGEYRQLSRHARVATHGGAALPLAVAGPFVAGALAGMLASRLAAPRLSGPLLQRVFAALMIAAAALLLWRALRPAG